MKEDILEELVDGYLLRQPAVFTKHNVKYRPDQTTIEKADKKKFSVHSDIDVLGVNVKNGKVFAVSCKSWQNGMDLKKYLALLANPAKQSTIRSGREVWKAFRELCHPIWARAFREKIYEETGSKRFTYIIAVTKLVNADLAEAFTANPYFLSHLNGDGEYEVNIQLLTLAEMISAINDDRNSTTVEATEIGRFLQLVGAAGLVIGEG
jgi:hypothetical protein